MMIMMTDHEAKIEADELQGLRFETLHTGTVLLPNACVVTSRRIRVSQIAYLSARGFVSELRSSGRRKRFLNVSPARGALRFLSHGLLESLRREAETTKGGLETKKL